MKIVTIVGARPQFIKAGIVSQKLRKLHKEILIHTGQHYDYNMSDAIFFDLEMLAPDFSLEVGSVTHGKQTGRMLEKIEEVLLSVKPDLTLVYGDTNSTIAGALAASKMHIPAMHVEAGLRSFNMRMPEEQNRILTDHISCYLSCPTDNAVENLRREGIKKGVYNTGDVMYDTAIYAKEIASAKSTILDKLKLNGNSYILATIHRAENADDYGRLQPIFEDSSSLSEKTLKNAICGMTALQ
jgi:UDP-GlcNAc3NAcA epimerase